ncbi:vacuolar protein sorting associated protein 37b [Echinococcus multilocularis]|uniref:Vacuolar protein sorting associated protein 37b n=1 Tax=Echinococcus multilocularis TaxID=6211 RepID=A0A068YCF9_ECHMU|nr:vacuolar protein sorting associated protein 37b [Echinococcus multilocularis]
MIPGNFEDKLAGMSKSELDDLFNNDNKIRKMVLDTPTVKKLEADKSRLWKSNQQKAIENLGHEPAMQKTKADLVSAHHKFNEALKAYSNYKSKLDEIRGSFSIQTMLALMKVANSEEDEMSEQLQKSFLKKQIGLEEFLTKMLDLRKSFNLRRIKIEKLSEMENSAGGQHSHSQQQPCAPSSSLPYPSVGRSHGLYPGL